MTTLRTQELTESREKYMQNLIIESIKECDERIKNLQELILPKNAWVYLSSSQEYTEFQIDMSMQYLDNDIKLAKIEKLIYNAMNSSSKNKIAPMLLSKFDELMSLTYDISGNLVSTGCRKEGVHIEYCKDTLKRREYIKMLCDYMSVV